jgi:hypothetical protein
MKLEYLKMVHQCECGYIHDNDIQASSKKVTSEGQRFTIL